MNLKLDSVTKPFKIESNQNTIMSDDDPILYFEYWILIFLGTIISLSIIIGILISGYYFIRSIRSDKKESDSEPLISYNTEN